MKNLAVIVVSKTAEVRKLVGGFLSSKGFRPFDQNVAICPLMAVVENNVLAKKVAENITKILTNSPVKKVGRVSRKNKPRVVLVIVGKRIGDITAKVDQVYDVQISPVGMYLDLELVLRSEKELYRGIKPGNPIKVPGKK